MLVSSLPQTHQEVVQLVVLALTVPTAWNDGVQIFPGLVSSLPSGLDTKVTLVRISLAISAIISPFIQPQILQITFLALIFSKGACALFILFIYIVSCIIYIYY